MIRVTLVFVILFNYSISSTNFFDYFKEQNLHHYQKVYGKNYYKVLKIIIEELVKLKDEKTITKLKKVNKLFNKFAYIPDKKLWKVDNYWATPLDFIGVKAGDSEDFALIKYIALITIGIDKNQLKLMSYKNKKNRYEENEYIILAYFSKDKNYPIVLDRVNRKLKKVSIHLLEEVSLPPNSYWKKYF